MTKFYCLGCGWNALIQVWNSKIGPRYVCKNCGMMGSMLDFDSPKLLNENEQADNETTFDFEKRIFKL